MRAHVLQYLPLGDVRLNTAMLLLRIIFVFMGVIQRCSSHYKHYLILLYIIVLVSVLGHAAKVGVEL